MDLPHKEQEASIVNKKVITMLNNPFDSVVAGKELDIFGVSTCLGIVGYNSQEQHSIWWSYLGSK